jgi:taurine dioxygenase
MTQQNKSQSAGFEVIPTGAALGAEIVGLDLRDVDADAFETLRETWVEHEVLLFRDQSLTDSDLVRFSSYMGELEHAPVQESGRRFVEGYPELYVVSNIIEDGVPIGSLGAGEAVWHTDMSYLPDPPIASVLYALEVPASGGETAFCTMTGSYAAMPESLKSRIEGLRVKHDGTYNSGGYVRAGLVPDDDPRTAPGTIHPLVCLHPESNKKSLYLGRRRNAYIEGFSLEDSSALLDEIWEFATRSEFTWQHDWRPGDVVLWDNRSTMHRRNAFDPESRRILHRTQIKGDAAPIAAT